MSGCDDKVFAMVCASNMNRSMEAHKLCLAAGLTTRSFGVGQHVKLPGANARSPNVYDFGTAYRFIYEDLKGKNEELYLRNGLLPMLERNMKIKEAPERWQLNRTDTFDCVVTFEQRVFETLVEDMRGRPQVTGESVLIVNIDVKDNAEEAAKAGPLAVDLCKMIGDSDDWEEDVDDIINKFQQNTGRRPLYTIMFY